VVWIENGRVAAEGVPAEVLPAFKDEMDRLGLRDADTDLAV
jgi:hypothetical protein